MLPKLFDGLKKKDEEKKITYMYLSINYNSKVDKREKIRRFKISSLHDASDFFIDASSFFTRRISLEQMYGD